METKPSLEPCLYDVPNEEWSFVALYLTPIRPDGLHRVPDLREVYCHGALDASDQRTVAVPTDQLPAAGNGLPANPAPNRGGRVRGHGA